MQGEGRWVQGHGVHDFGLEDREAYVRFPETMLVLTAYIHAKISRLANILDERIMRGGAVLGREVGGHGGVEALAQGSDGSWPGLNYTYS